VLFAAAAGPAYSADCSFEPQGEGRVAAVVDPRSFRLQDGREVRLAGIEPATSEKPLSGKSLANGTPALAASPPMCSSFLPRLWCKANCWRKVKRWSPLL
jgi:hypothetical protein